MTLTMSQLRGAFLPGRPMEAASAVDLLLRAEAAAPNRRHVIWAEGEMTVGEIAAGVRQWAGWLVAQGVGVGDRVGLVWHNSAEFIVLQLAVQMCGAIEVPINYELRGALLEHVVRDAEPVLVLVSEDLASHLLAPIAAWARVVAVGDGLRRQVRGGKPLSAPVPMSLAAPGSMLYTSGTSGPSKGVVLPRGYLCECASNWIAACALTGDDVIYCSTPIFHIDGHVLNTVCLMTGATFALRSRFSVSEFWTDAATFGATVFLAVGAMLEALRARRPGLPPEHSYRLGIGSPFSQPVFEYFEDELGIPLLQLYGQTEADGVTFETPNRRRRKCAGWACCGFDLKIVDEHEETRPVGETGLILYRPLRRHMMTLGYHNHPEATAKASLGMWWHTGDLGHVDEDGFLWFDGRASDSLRRRGENISSWELESAIAAFEGVRTVAAVAVPDEIGGEDEIKIFLSLDDTGTWTPDGFFAACEQQLPRFAQPLFVQVVEDAVFVRGPGTGAVQKHLLDHDPLATIDRRSFASR